MDQCVCNAHSLLTTFAPSGVVLEWFNRDPNPANRALIRARIDAGGYWAWRAQNSPGTPWPNGPGSYAESRVDEAQGVTLGEIGGGPVTWTAAAGWDDFFALTRALDTTIVTPGTGWAMLCQYTNNAGNSSVVCGAQSGGNTRWFLYPRIILNDILYCSGNFSTIAPAIASGNLTLLSQVGYKNGVVDAPAIGAWGGAGTFSTYIGGLNSSGALTFDCTGQVQALILCDDATAILPNLASLVALPNGSMHNL